jgi:hypothetical protein
VSAGVSSPITAFAARPRRAPAGRDPAQVDLLATLTAVPDPRPRRGARHGFVAVPAIGVCVVLAGARTFTAVGEWFHDLTPAVRTRRGLGRGIEHWIGQDVHRRRRHKP